MSGLESVNSFGMSLSSGYDVDDNGYNGEPVVLNNACCILCLAKLILLDFSCDTLFLDLVVGAGFNETVVVLR